MLQVVAKPDGHEEPDDGRKNRTRNHAVPRLGAGNGVVINESDDSDAGQGRDDPAKSAPHQQNVRAEIGIEIRYQPVLELAADCNQDGGEGHGYQCEDHQHERDQALLYQSPGLGQFVAAPEALHPGNHDAGSGPESNQRGCEQKSEALLRGDVEVVQDGIAAGGKDAAERVGDLTQIRSALPPIGENGSEND